MAVITVTESNFEKEVRSFQGKVLLDFWASWCGPCQMMAPVVHSVADERSDVKVGKINVDEEGALAQKFGIMSIPTLVLMENGKPLRQMVGYRVKDEVVKFLDD